MSVPSTIMLVPLSNLTVTPGSTVKKTSTRTKTSVVTVYGLPDNVQVVLVVIPPPTFVLETTIGEAKVTIVSTLLSESPTKINVKTIASTTFFDSPVSLCKSHPATFIFSTYYITDHEIEVTLVDDGPAKDC